MLIWLSDLIRTNTDIIHHQVLIQNIQNWTNKKRNFTDIIQFQTRFWNKFRSHDFFSVGMILDLPCVAVVQCTELRAAMSSSHWTHNQMVARDLWHVWYLLWAMRCWRWDKHCWSRLRSAGAQKSYSSRSRGKQSTEVSEENKPLLTSARHHWKQTVSCKIFLATGCNVS